MKKLKVAVIGVGSISGVHLINYKNNPNTEIVALCDINRETLERRGKEFGVTALYEDYTEMLAKEKIDIVSVCTWNSVHAPATIAALNAGAHVLCEKPMAMNTAQAEEMREAARRNGKILQVGFVRRFGRDAEVIRDFSSHGALGDLYFARAFYVRRNGNPGGWFGDKSRSGGGPLIDLGVHVIDLVRYLMGNPKPVSVYGATYHKLGNRPNIRRAPGSYSAMVTSKKDICDVEDFAAAYIRFENGATLDVQAGFSLNLGKSEMNLELFGDKGGVKLDPEFKLYTEMNDYLADVSLDAKTDFDGEAAFTAEINGFVDAVLGKAPVRATAEDGIELMKIIDAIYASAESGHEIILK